MADPSKSRAKRPKRDEPTRPGAEQASVEKIKTVSSLLESKKFLLDRPPSQVKISLPDLSRSIGDVINRSKTLPTQPSKFDGHSILLDPNQVKFPEGGATDSSKDVEQPREEEPEARNGMGDHPSPSVAANVDPTPVGRAIPSASLPVKDAAATANPNSTVEERPSASSSIARNDEAIKGVSGALHRPQEGTITGPRSVPTTAIHAEGGALLDSRRLGDIQAQAASGSVIGYSGQSDPIQVGGDQAPMDRKEADDSTKVAVVAQPQEEKGVKTPPGSRNLAGVQGSDARVGHSGLTTDHRPNSSIHAEPSMNFVRNPLSTDLRNFSLASPADSGQDGSSSDQGGFANGSGDQASGGSTSSQVGTSGDLSKTNELLQQLIDAVRKQRGSALPPGGPSVYPDR